MLLPTWLLVALLAGAAHAAPAPAKVSFKDLPPGTEIVGMSPGNYYRVLIGEEYGKVEELVARVRKHAADGDPAEAAESYGNLHERLVEAKKRLVGFPAYKDEDGTLRDAVIAAYTEWIALAALERDEAAPLGAKLPKSDADTKAWEKSRTKLDKRWSSSNEKVREVVQGFAEANRLVFVEEDDQAAKVAPFDADLPIGQANLDEALWVAAAVRYHNALYAQAGTMVKAMNEAADKMNTSELEPARVTALEQVKPALAEAKTFGGFGDNQALRDEIVAYGEWMMVQLEGPLKTHAELTKTGKVTRAQAEELDAITESFNQGATEHAAALKRQLDQFQQSWHFAAFVEWQKSRK